MAQLSNAGTSTQLRPGFLGKLGQRKGAYELVEAVAKIRLVIPSIKLLLGQAGRQRVKRQFSAAAVTEESAIGAIGKGVKVALGVFAVADGLGRRR